MPTVFISYAHDDDDDDEHRAWVRGIADELAGRGLEVVCDADVELDPPGGFTHWSETSFEDADFVVVVGSPAYKRRWEGREEPGKGHGVAFEARLIKQWIAEHPHDTGKIIGVLRHGRDPLEDLPRILRGGRIFRLPEELAKLEQRLGITHPPRSRSWLSRFFFGQPKDARPTAETRATTVPPPARVLMPDKITGFEFKKQLDRTAAWSRFLEQCRTNDDLVMWVAGDAQQNVGLFYGRIRRELRRARDHRTVSFRASEGDEATAEEWVGTLVEHLGGTGDDLAAALDHATQEQPAMLLLESHRGPIHEDGLSDPYLEELVEFVEERFIPALAEAERDHPVRLFMAIQTAAPGDSRVATALRDAVDRALKRHPSAVGRWEVDEVVLPSWDDVSSSVEALLRPGRPLGTAERTDLRREYDAFDRNVGTMSGLAKRLYPIYERLYDARAGDADDA